MISLRSAAAKLSTSHTTVKRIASELGIDTTKGVSELDFQRIERKLNPSDDTEKVESAEIVYLEPMFQLNLPELKPVENHIVPVITEEQVEAVRSYVDSYQKQMEREIALAQAEIEETRKRNAELELEVYRMELLKAKAAKLRMQQTLEKTTEELRSGKSITNLQGENGK